MAELFDRVISGINKSVNSVSEGSKLMVEKANLNTEKRKLDNSRNDLYRQLGVLVYNLKTEGKIDIPETDAVCETITECSRKISVLDDKLRLLEANKQTGQSNGSVVCSRCGYGNKSGANFCTECGMKIQ